MSNVLNLFPDGADPEEALATDYFGNEFDPTANIPESLTCDRCGEHIDNVAQGNVIAFRSPDPVWIVIHKKCAQRDEQHLGWYELRCIFRDPVMYTFRATMRPMNDGLGKPRALRSWFEGMEKITGRDVFHRTNGCIDDPIWSED